MKIGRQPGQPALLPAVLLLFCFLASGCGGRLPEPDNHIDHKIYLAFGFHGNLYHSYRIDTPDEAGFGKDIRIIRHLIKVFDKSNRQGINVRATWDFDNLFSLQERLPVHAPDIIEAIRRRVAAGKDEIHLMSYNNGAASAMTRREFEDAVKLAIQNDKGSGVQDLFPAYAPIVRPQEMMVTPGNYNLYRKLGMEAVVLYYSAITFDAIRLFVRPLTDTEAFNPLTYRNPDTDERLTVLPAYNIGDLIENVSLRKWVRDLRAKQVSGKIDRDLLIYINFDADDPYWYGYKLPWYLAWLPNTGGMEQLIAGVADLPYVAFTTPGDYLRSHPPVGEISMGQDLADGNFNGYDSWAGKASSHMTWQRVMEDRRNHRFADRAAGYLGRETVRPDQQALLDTAYKKRLRLLSTTNFGMAAPYLARARERIVEQMVEAMITPSTRARKKAEKAIADRLDEKTFGVKEGALRFLDRFTCLDGNDLQAWGPGLFLSLDLTGFRVTEDDAVYARAPDGRMLRAVPVTGTTAAAQPLSKTTLFIPADKPFKEGDWELYAGPAVDPVPAKDRASANADALKNDTVEVRFAPNGIIEGVFFKGERQLEAGSLLPYVHYKEAAGSRIFSPTAIDLIVEADGRRGAATIRLTGDFPMAPVPGAKPGRFDYRLTLISGVPYLFLDGKIIYPETPRMDTMGSKRPALTRKYDAGWIETAPAELRFTHGADQAHPFRVIKRNFIGVESSYPIDYFRHAEKNLNLACINNHLTPEYVAVAGGGRGMAVAMDTKTAASMAFCPMRMDWNGQAEQFSLRLNPFGTYFGSQWRQPTWGNGQGYEAALASGQQYTSSAPTYNGFAHAFSLMTAFFSGDDLPEPVKHDLVGFARPPFAVFAHMKPAPAETDFFDAPFLPPAGVTAGFDGKTLFVHWERARGNPKAYRLYMGTAPGAYDKVLDISATTARITGFNAGQTLYAAVSSIGADGSESGKSREIEFMVAEPEKSGGPDIPLGLQLKILWSGIKASLE
jgi:hypothetical protein